MEHLQFNAEMTSGAPRFNLFVFMVPEAGIEPAHPYG